MTEEHERVIELTVEVPGPPDQVWAAVATGPGISSWFVPFSVEERDGGAVGMDFGGLGRADGTVTAWQPPHRFAYRGGEEERSLAYEWLVEARDGGTCVVRLVNSGFGPGAEWDAEFDGMAEGWRIFLEVLRLHLTHFPGRTARAAVPTGLTEGPNGEALSRLCSGLGLGREPAPGERFTTAGPGVPALTGSVVGSLRRPRASAHLLLVDGPVPGTGFLAAEGDGDQVSVSAYLYLYGDGCEDVLTGWTAAIGERFPFPG